MFSLQFEINQLQLNVRRIIFYSLRLALQTEHYSHIYMIFDTSTMLQMKPKRILH